jgi:hypothetical protein
MRGRGPVETAPSSVSMFAQEEAMTHFHIYKERHNGAPPSDLILSRLARQPSETFTAESDVMKFYESWLDANPRPSERRAEKLAFVGAELDRLNNVVDFYWTSSEHVQVLIIPCPPREGIPGSDKPHRCPVGIS